MVSKRVLLLGDSLRLAYQPGVAKRLAAEPGMRIEVIGPEMSSGDSNDLAGAIDDLLDRFNPDAVHFNSGLEDVRWFRTRHQNAVRVGDYGINLKRVVDACKPRLGGDIVFALTTPVIDRLQCDVAGTEFDRCNRDIEEYNIAATQVMLADNVLVNHLDRVIVARDDEYIAPDGVSLTIAGVEAAARAVADCIRTLWH